uniref:Merozoite surface protein 1 n=1 Tax=Plasmodium yoelii yoelii TaxID=73239 RepID=UPI0003ED1A56|nr:Chain A, Merozoite surface protein 1 [Plasmodium yoelii yoelii]
GVDPKHVCVDTRDIPKNAGCFRDDDGTEEWRCLLGYKKGEGNTCVENNNPTCDINNGGCDPTASCQNAESTENSKKIICTCKEPTPNAYYEGVFCSSSS